MKLSFTKMHGCGNDFLFLDLMNEDQPQLLTKDQILFLCDRNFGIGADGVVILERLRTGHNQWHFYNSDGSEAEMCGNAARCAIRYLSEAYFPEHEVTAMETLAGTIKGKVLDPTTGRVEVTLMSRGQARFDYEEKTIRFEDDVLRLFCLDTGVPHAVLEVKEIRRYPIEKVGRFLVGHSAFEPEGTNVTFFEKSVGQRIISTTFERGVEKETYACGTGAAAAALIFSQLYMMPLPVEVSVPGGDLEVDISPQAKMLLLRGQTDYVMRIDLDEVPQDFEKKTLYSDPTVGGERG
jgi:diaminopimelate epimerase